MSTWPPKQYLASQPSGPGDTEGTLNAASGLRIGTMSGILTWEPELLTGRRNLGSGHAPDVNNVTPGIAEIGEELDWKEIKLFAHNLPFPCTPAIRIRETAGDDSFATPAPGGVRIKVRVEGFDHFNQRIVYEMPSFVETFPNDVVGSFVNADNRALDTILHLPVVFSKVMRVWFQADRNTTIHPGAFPSGVFLDVGVAWAIDAGFTIFHENPNGAGAGGPSLTKYGTDQPSFRAPFWRNQAVGLPLALDGYDPYLVKAGQTVVPWPKLDLAPEIMCAQLWNIDDGEIASLASAPPFTGGIVGDVSDASVHNGTTTLTTEYGGFYLNEPVVFMAGTGVVLQDERLSWRLGIGAASHPAVPRDTAGTKGPRNWGLSVYDLTTGTGVNTKSVWFTVMFQTKLNTPQDQAGSTYVT